MKFLFLFCLIFVSSCGVSDWIQTRIPLSPIGVSNSTRKVGYSPYNQLYGKRLMKRKKYPDYFRQPVYQRRMRQEKIKSNKTYQNFLW